MCIALCCACISRMFVLFIVCLSRYGSARLMHSCTPYSPGFSLGGGALKMIHGGIDLVRAALDLVSCSASTCVSWNCASIAVVLSVRMVFFGFW